MDNGVAYTLPGISAEEWTSMPMGFTGAAELGARLLSLYNDGIGERDAERFLLPWPEVYEILNKPDTAGFRQHLMLPADTGIRPRLDNSGSLSDSSFSILVREWVDERGVPLRSGPTLAGAVAIVGGTQGLLARDVWELLKELRGFLARPESDRNQSFHERAWSRMRRLAVSTHSPVSDFLERTIVLTPERLKLELRRAGEGEYKTVEVLPVFQDSPGTWVSTFDRFSEVQDTYSVPDGPVLTRVIVTPAVKRVLQEIKRMPGRRVAGPRAEAFVRNPFGVLGPEATEVIDAEQFEEAREEAGLLFEQFTPRAQRDAAGRLVGVSLSIRRFGSGDPVTDDQPFRSPAELADFVTTLGRRLRDGSQCCFWQGYELEIQGDTQEHLGQLKSWLIEWRTGDVWTAAEVLDLTNYSERIGAIGQERPYALPFIVRKETTDGWFPENVLLAFQIEAEGDAPAAMVPVTLEQVPAIVAAVSAARGNGASEVQLPGAPRSVPFADAERIASVFAEVSKDVREGSVDRKLTEKLANKAKEKTPRRHLLIKSNIETVDYSEARADALALAPGRSPALPKSLNPGVQLKDHQVHGVAWLQHLFRQSPTHCRGAVLADDMGLGKTLQLLAFIAEYLESGQNGDPVLIVAPVALLENWKNEIDKFFRPEAFRVLTLYGDELKASRLPEHELAAELKEQGITRLLRKNWLGSANLVLTTYETLRDLEFSLAAQPWSIMVCDEAQKIKNPNALVTRAAKKQKVQFRVACTGTPVENTLMDLWCLFDFVQPGLLGSLQHFGRTYRRPIEASTDEQKARVAELRTLIEPQVLHRRKSEVATELPRKLEHGECKRLPMSGMQLGVYHRAIERLKQERDSDPSAQLQTLHLIRMLCSDPHWVLPDKSRGVKLDQLISESPKMKWLVARLQTLADKETAEKAIIFCEFRELQLTLQRVVYAHFRFMPHIVNGDTLADPRAQRNRQKLIDDFQVQTGFNVIILSPQAVGFGVNIQAANHVIHFTRTWNPAKEDQATDRAYRIGQTRDVTVYTPGVTALGFKTFDEKLDELLTWKRTLAADMLNGSPDVSVEDFADLVQ
jgi:hypothetical protein